MTGRRQRWAALQHNETRQVELGQALALCHATHVDMQQLTGTAQWDRYLRLAATIQAADIAYAEELAARLSSSDYLPLEQLSALRHDLSLARARIAARTELLTLPARVVAGTSLDPV